MVRRKFIEDSDHRAVREAVLPPAGMSGFNLQIQFVATFGFSYTQFQVLCPCNCYFLGTGMSSYFTESGFMKGNHCCWAEP